MEIIGVYRYKNNYLRLCLLAKDGELELNFPIWYAFDDNDKSVIRWSATTVVPELDEIEKVSLPEMFDICTELKKAGFSRVNN